METHSFFHGIITHNGWCPVSMLFPLDFVCACFHACVSAKTGWGVQQGEFRVELLFYLMSLQWIGTVAAVPSDILSDSTQSTIC